MEEETQRLKSCVVWLEASDNCYRENIPMAWGVPQQTVWHQKSKPFSIMLDKLTKLTTEG